METKEEAVFRVLPPDARRAKFAKVATELGFTQAHVWEPGPDRRDYEEAWATADQKRAVNYVEDTASEEAFLSFRGHDLVRTVFDFCSALRCFTPSELLKKAHSKSSNDEHVDNLFRLAITFPRYDPEVWETFARFAVEPKSPLLRRAALAAISYRSWPESYRVVEHVAANDSDPSVRQHASELLRALGEIGANRQEGA